MRKFYVELAGNKIFTALIRFTFRLWWRCLAIVFLLCCTMQYSNSQIVTQGAEVKANFGIDADLYTNYLMVDSGYATPAMTDDWFENLSVYAGTGTPVFAPTQDYIDSVLAAILLDNNFGFSFRMYDFGHIPRNTKIGDITWIDGVYARDNNATQSNTDASVFAGTKDKNADNPTTWNLGDAGTPIKDDLIEVMGHMRIDDNIDDDGDGNPDVWGIGAFTTVNSDGNAHADFEFFAREIGYDGSSLTNTGNEGGRTAWVFDEFGNVVSAGALVVSIDFENGGTEPHASVRIWVSEDDYNMLNSKTNNPFEFINGDFNQGLESGVYGYGGIQPLVNSNSPAVWAIVNVDSTTLGPPWGSLESSTADWVEELGELQFAEFAINLSYLGLDAFGGDACNKTLGSLMVKTRSSSEFTAELKDFAGPFVFGFDLETKIVTINLDSCDDGENEFDLATAVDSTGDGIVTFYSTGADAFAHTNEIASTQTLPVGDTMFWARSSNPEDSLCFVIDSFMVAVHDNPVCNVTTTDETYFNAGNGTAKVTVTGGEGPFTYLWVPSNGGTIGGGQGTDSIYDLTDGRYDVYITDANGCETSCYDSLSWAPTAPTCAVFAIDVECFGAETGTVWAEVTPSDTIGYPPYTYYWFKDGTPFDTVISNETTDTMFNMGAGIYDVEVLNAVDPNSTLCYDTIFQPDPNPVSVECAGVTIDGCQGQSSVDLDFGNWLDTAFVVTGGTDPLDTVYKVGDVVVDLDTVSAPYYCGGDVNVRMIVSDYCGLVDSCDATFSVTPDVTPPVITGVEADTTIECPDVPSWSVPSANDACFGPVQLTMEDDTSSFACPLVITRTWRAEDDCGNTSTASQTITVIDTTPPMITGVAADTTIECPDVPVFSTPQASDDCDDNVTLTSSMDTSSYACPLVITRTWKAEDDCGNTSMASQTITVIDTSPPVITGVGDDMEIECPNDPVFSTPQASDGCDDNVTLTSSMDTSSYACPLVITKTWKAEDDCGNTSMASQTITVIDTTPPVITGVGDDMEIECPNDPVFRTPQASDGCDDNVTLTSSMDTSSYACPLVITKTWKAEDDCGNTSMASQTITVIDTTLPVITGVGDDMEIECPNDPVFRTPQASDGCDDNVTLTSSMDTSSYACPLVITKTWKAEDDCGNTSMASQTITVIDTTPPVITGVGDDMEIECPNDPGFSTPQASDGCDDNVTLTSSMDTSSYACPLVITKTWKAEDDCGNTSMASQTITVIDTTPPVITGVGDDMEIECPDVPVFSTPQASDGCDDNVTLTSSMDTSSYACPLVITKTWKAEDDCGNTSMASQTITVIDTTPPILILPVDYEDYLCNDYPGDLTATFTDECSDDGSITVSPVMSGSTLCEEIYTYTFTARDDCGNTTTDSITVVREWESLEDCETAFARLPEDLPAPSRPYDSKTNPDPYAGTDAIGARCFIDDVFERWGWVNRVKKDSTYYLPVYAGAGQCDVTKGDSVGTVTLAFYGDTVTVMFDLIAPWVMTEAHIYVGEDMYPTFKNGKHKDEATVAPGQYNLVYENGDPITDLKVGYYNAPEYVYVIVHAVTCRPLCYCDETIYQGFDAGLYSLVQTRGNKNKAAVTSDVTDFVSGELKVFPNPFTEKVTFEFVSATDSYGTLDIYSVTGQHVARILDRPVLSGELNRINYEPDHDVSGIYIYRLKLDDNVQVGRIIYKE